MTTPTDNENWLIDIGDSIINKKAQIGFNSLTDHERLIYCLWVMDYSMRNAGDLKTAPDVYANYKDTGLAMAKKLLLNKAAEAFSMDTSNIEKLYFNIFESLCTEIRNYQIA